MQSTLRIGLALGAIFLATGCSSIEQQRGYIIDQVLVASVEPGLDNKQSVQAALGHPSLKSQFGDERWYYISSRTEQAPFTTPDIESHNVLTLDFDEAGNVLSAEWTGMENVVHLDPDGDATATLGRHRGLLQDLFGNIGQVGAPGLGS